MSPATLALIEAKKAERAKAGLKVINLDSGWQGYFKDEASRDEFVARATRMGERVEIA